MGSRQSTTPNVPQWIDEFWSDLNHHYIKCTLSMHDYGFADFFGVKDDFVGNTFDAQSSKPVVFARQQTSADEPCGVWLHKHKDGYAGAFHHDFAVAPEWGNAGKEYKILIVPPGIRWLEGVAAPKHTFSGFWPGGGTQVYLPADVVSVLDKATQTFCKSPPCKQSYDAFLRDCKDAFEQQKSWLMQFDTMRQKVRTEATFHNSIHAIVKSCSKIANAILVTSGESVVNGHDVMNMYASIEKLKGTTVPHNVVDSAKCDQLLKETLDFVCNIRDVVHERTTQVQRHETMIKYLVENPKYADLSMLPPTLKNMLSNGANGVAGNTYDIDKHQTWKIKQMSPDLCAYLEYSHTEHSGNKIIHWFRFVFRPG